MAHFKCFVIAPFGDAESQDVEQVRLAQVRKYLRQHLYPLVEELCAEEPRFNKNACEAHIEDGLDRPGSEDLQVKIFNAILDADLVFTVISGNRPNIYLELGWAQALWREPICLVDKHSSTEFPSDIDGLERRFFDIAMLEDPNGSKLRELAIDLAKLTVQRLSRSKFVVPRVADFKERRVAATGKLRVYERFSSGVSLRDWTEILEAAEQEIVIAVPKLYKLTKTPPLDEDYLAERRPELIEAYKSTCADVEKHNEAVRKSWRGPFGRKALTPPTLLSLYLYQRVVQDNINVTILANSVTNFRKEQLQARFVGTDLYDEHEQMRHALFVWQSQWDAFTTGVIHGEVSNRSPSQFRVIQLQSRTLPYRVTFTEKRTLATLRFFTEPFNSMHCIDAEAPSEDEDTQYVKTFHTMMRNELNFLIAENSQSSIDHFVAQFPASRRAFK